MCTNIYEYIAPLRTDIALLTKSSSYNPEEATKTSCRRLKEKANLIPSNSMNNIKSGNFQNIDQKVNSTRRTAFIFS